MPTLNRIGKDAVINHHKRGAHDWQEMGRTQRRAMSIHHAAGSRLECDFGEANKLSTYRSRKLDG